MYPYSPPINGVVYTVDAIGCCVFIETLLLHLDGLFSCANGQHPHSSASITDSLMSIFQYCIIESEVDYMLCHTVIVPCASAWLNHILLVPKPASVHRLCIAFWSLDAGIVKGWLQLPPLEEFETLHWAQFLSTIGFIKCYGQLLVAQGATCGSFDVALLRVGGFVSDKHMIFFIFPYFLLG